jgi:ribosome biogenesis GTPase / thiamine phosphate phosphatase
MSEAKEVTRLESLGYNQFFEDCRLSLNVGIDCVARVIAEHRGAYEIINLDGEFRAVVSGKLMLVASCRGDYPAVGDWVVIKENTDNEKIIEHILPRQTLLRKKYSGKDEAQLIAANVGVAFIVESLDRDYNINRFERYIVLAQEGGVRPVIILNKTDLITDDELSERVNQLKKRFIGIDVICTATLTKAGVINVSNYINAGTTYCFLGSSGVGKSTIINKLLNQDIIDTKEIGAKTGRGRHTTTARQMYFMASGGIIIDNPGSREVGIIGFGNDTKDVFFDINKYSQNCRFKDCKHHSETGCAVRAALESGDIDTMQYENYQKLQKETEHYELSVYDRRQKDKKFGKFIKNAKVDLKKYSSK